MVRDVSYRIIGFFLSIYRFVVIYVIIISFLIVPFYYLALVLAFYYNFLTAYLPIGPLPLGLLPWCFFKYFNSVFQDLLRSDYGVYICTMIILGLVMVKLYVFTLLKNIRIFGFRLVLVLLIVLIIGFAEVLSYYYMEHYAYGDIVKTILLYTYWLIGMSLPVDVVLLTYILYRDAIICNSRNMGKYLIIIPTIWLSIIWVNIIVEPRIIQSILHPHENISIAIMVLMWFIVTIIELIIHINYYRKKQIVTEY